MEITHIGLGKFQQPKLLKNFNNFYKIIQQRLQTLIDSSHIITFCVSILVIIYGSFKSLNIDSDNEHKSDSVDEKSDQQITQNIDITHALLIPLAASLSLLLMFFFFDSIQTIFLLCTSSNNS